MKKLNNVLLISALGLASIPLSVQENEYNLSLAVSEMVQLAHSTISMEREALDEVKLSLDGTKQSNL